MAVFFIYMEDRINAQKTPTPLAYIQDILCYTIHQ